MRTEIFILVYSVQIESTEDAKVYVSPLAVFAPRPPGLGALHHADVDGLADVHDEAEDLREDVRGGGDVEAADAGAAPPAGC